jgi:hypothetical protein
VLGRWSLSENIFAIIVKEAIHRHQVVLDLIHCIPWIKRPANEPTSIDVANLDIIVIQKASEGLADKPMYLANTMLWAPTIAQLTNQTGRGNSFRA